MLGRHLFARIGAGVRIHWGVDLTFGYKLTIEEGVTIRQRALLNDRGGIVLGKGAVIGSFARIYSHSHAPSDFQHVSLTPTVIGPAARIASHAIVLGGQNIPAGSTVGAFPGATAV
jgi:acetyltransferase-like isoleucine patch superfamily enzyme